MQIIDFKNAPGAICFSPGGGGGTPAVLGEGEFNPDIVDNVYLAEDYNLDGFSSVIVNKVDSSIDSSIKPENIKAGVSILRVNGTLEEADYDDIYEALDDLNAGEYLGPKNYFDGTVDVEGLRAIGWDDDDIKYLKDNVFWYSWENDKYKVNQDTKYLYNSMNDTSIWGSTYMTFNETINNNKNIIYYPKLYGNRLTQWRYQYNQVSCSSLKYIRAYPYLDNSTYSHIQGIFYQNNNLRTVPILMKSGDKKITSLECTFYGCYRLNSIPLLDTEESTLFKNAFSFCSALSTIPPINTSKGTSFNSMFASCGSLISIPLIDTSNGIEFTSMFQNCNNLSDVPTLNTSKGIYFNNMFMNCGKLTSIPLINTSNGTIFSSMFSSCNLLTTIPALNTSNGTDFSNMFQSCGSLTTVPALDTSKGTRLNSMFNSCTRLETIEGIDFSGLTSNQTSATYMFPSSTRVLTSITVNGYINYTLNFSSLYAIDYDSVKSILSAASRTTNTNAKTLTFNRTMTDQEGELATLVSDCTSKGWTITGLTLN